MTSESSFWTQLRERRVVRVAIVYGAVSWALVEATDLLTGILELPAWVPRLTLVLLVLGFPLAVGLAWAFDVTPGGVRRTPSDASDRTPRIVLAGVAVLSLLLASALGTWLVGPGTPISSVVPTGPVAEREGRPSVAVLPLENRSSIPDQGYFVDGLHDELITQLSRIEDLVVTSRTSVMGYREGGNIREIGQALGVGAIVEGGVERVGDRIRVIVQLIDAERDEHLFAATYDEVLTPENLFEIRSDLTLRIADSLHAALTPDETRRIRASPTDNMAAYDLVLRGRELYDGSPEDVEKALEFFAQATRIAPEYADAWAWLGMAYQQRAQKGGYGPDMRDSAQAHAREALRHDPESARAYRLLGDFERALELQPNWSTVLISQSSFAWWARRHVEGIRLMERARGVAPNDPLVAEHFADHAYYLMLDDEYDRWMGEVRRIDPEYYWLSVFESLYSGERQEFGRAERELSLVRQRDPGDPMVRWLEMRLGLVTRDAERVEEAARALVTDQSEWDWWGQQIQSRVLLAWARSESDGAPSTEVRGLLDDALARVDALGGEASPQELYAAAQAHMVAGHPDEALVALQGAVAAGFPNLRLLRVDPIWDPVRGEPSFVEAERIVDDDLAAQRREAIPLLASIR